MTNEEGLS